MENEPEFVIELTEEEVKTLILIFRRVGGSPKNSPRRHSDAIYDKISEFLTAEEEDQLIDDSEELVSGSIIFGDFVDAKIITRKPF